MAAFPSCPRRLPPSRGDQGFTLVEISITVAILLVGVLGMVAVVDGAHSTTADNRAREGATALAREMIEAVRSLPYSGLENAEIEARLQTRPGLEDSNGAAAGYTVERRGFTYTASADACSFDDAADGLGAHGGGLVFCAQSTATGNSDDNPDDYRRIRLTLTWQRSAKEETAYQTTLVTNPSGGLGPTVTALDPAAPATAEITDPGMSSADFEVTTNTTPASVEWYVNGATEGLATGSETGWSFTWPLGSVLDGTYLVQARAFNSEGRAGAARAATVVLNRFAPNAPTGGLAGLNNRGGDVDIEWQANGEGDVIGYRVWRVDGAGARIERACPPAASSQSFLDTTLSCVDSAAGGGPQRYSIVALDRDPGQAVREGSGTTVVTAENNLPPRAPSGLTICQGGSIGCNNADGQPAPAGTTVLRWNAATDPDADDSIRFYRIYRDGTGYDARVDRIYATSEAPMWVDSNTGGAAHEYRVSSVDQRLGESDLTDAVSG